MFANETVPENPDPGGHWLQLLLPGGKHQLGPEEKDREEWNVSQRNLYFFFLFLRAGRRTRYFSPFPFCKLRWFLSGVNCYSGITGCDRVPEESDQGRAGPCQVR